MTLKQQILADAEQGRQEGVLASPTLFMGNRRLHGRLTQARLVPLIHYYIQRTNASVLSTVDSDNGLVQWSGVEYR